MRQLFNEKPQLTAKLFQDDSNSNAAENDV